MFRLSIAGYNVKADVTRQLLLTNPLFLSISELSLPITKTTTHRTAKMGSTTDYNVQSETQRIFHDGILANPLMSTLLPADLAGLAKHVHFTGSPTPLIPINWRFAESAAATKALEASMLNLLITKKYGVASY